MINRYEGNTGRVVKLPEAQDLAAVPPPPPPPRPRPGRGPFPGFADLGRILPGMQDFETEDLLLVLILYLLYRESGDEELLVILGAMFLL